MSVEQFVALSRNVSTFLHFLWSAWRACIRACGVCRYRFCCRCPPPAALSICIDLDLTRATQTQLTLTIAYTATIPARAQHLIRLSDFTYCLSLFCTWVLRFNIKPTWAAITTMTSITPHWHFIVGEEWFDFHKILKGALASFWKYYKSKAKQRPRLDPWRNRQTWDVRVYGESKTRGRRACIRREIWVNGTQREARRGGLRPWRFADDYRCFLFVHKIAQRCRCWPVCTRRAGRRAARGDQPELQLQNNAHFPHRDAFIVRRRGNYIITNLYVFYTLTDTWFDLESSVYHRFCAIDLNKALKGFRGSELLLNFSYQPQEKTIILLNLDVLQATVFHIWPK